LQPEAPKPIGIDSTVNDLISTLTPTHYDQYKDILVQKALTKEEIAIASVEGHLKILETAPETNTPAQFASEIGEAIIEAKNTTDSDYLLKEIKRETIKSDLAISLLVRLLNMSFTSSQKLEKVEGFLTTLTTVPANNQTTGFKTSLGNYKDAIEATRNHINGLVTQSKSQIVIKLAKEKATRVEETPIVTTSTSGAFFLKGTTSMMAGALLLSCAAMLFF